MLDLNKVAAAIAAAYILVMLGGVLLNFVFTGDAFTLKYSLSLPSVWIAVGACLVISWGLWQRFRWAWWLGFVAATGRLLDQLHPERFSYWGYCLLSCLP
jgi:hypothetical protein